MYLSFTLGFNTRFNIRATKNLNKVSRPTKERKETKMIPRTCMWMYIYSMSTMNVN